MPLSLAPADLSTRVLVLMGCIATAIAVAMLLLPLATPLLVASGLIGGAGGAIVLTPADPTLRGRGHGPTGPEPLDQDHEDARVTVGAR